MLALLPPGRMWPRTADSNLGRLLRAPAEAIAGLEASAEALLPEADVRRAVALLIDYERVLGTDECGHLMLDLSAADRRAVAHARWIAGGGQSPAYFVALAAAMGTAITITEQHVSQFGVAVYDDEYTPEGEQFVWIVNLSAERLIDPEYGVTEYGDRYGDIVLNVCECVIRQHAPAHTTVVFNYV